MKYVLTMLLLICRAAHAAPENDSFRLVISAGALEEGGSFEPFYNSRIFIGEKDPPFFVSQAAGVQVYSAPDGTIFYAEGPLSPEQIIKASAKATHNKSHAIISQSYGAFVSSDSVDEEELAKIVSYLGALQKKVELKTRIIDGKRIVATRLWGQKDDMLWPRDPASLKRIPAVIIASKNIKLVVVARSVGAWENKMALVDELLRKAGEPSGYIDLGVSGAKASFTPAIIAEVARRKPLAVFAGTLEMTALLQHPEQKALIPFVLPFAQEAERAYKAEGRRPAVTLWALANGENIWPLFAGLGQVQTLKAKLNSMSALEGAKKRPINVVRVFSEEAANTAAKSRFVDLVLMVADASSAQLPSKELIELKNASLDTNEQRAPIIHLSPLDVSEVTLRDNAQGNFQRLEVVRHPITDQSLSVSRPAASAATTMKPALPSLGRPYETSDFDNVLGGMIANYTGADVAIFESENSVTPISGPIAYEIAMARLKRNGIIATATINGKQLKRLVGLKSQDVLRRKLSFFGLNEKAKTIREMPIHDGERYKIALSEVALLEGFNVARLGGFYEEVAVRAYFVELIHGKVDNLWFVGGQKYIPSLDTVTAFNDALGNLRSQIPLVELVERELGGVSDDQVKTYIDMPAGKPRPTILLDIGYLDFGLSMNRGNQTYVNYQKKKDGESLPMSRASVAPYTHLILLSKINMIFDMPELIIQLGNSTKYMHYDFDEKPVRDKTTFNLDFRLPWERSIFRGKDPVFSPILKFLYDTKLAPIPGLSKNTQEEWEKKKLPRVHRVDTLLGLNMASKKLGFSLDFGPFMVTDFTQHSVHDALNFGPGFIFDGRWPLFGPLEFATNISGYYLFPLPKNTALNKTALAIEGTAWLRFARYYDFSMSIMSDFLLATLQQKPRDLAKSAILGVTLSYGSVIRLLN